MQNWNFARLPGGSLDSDSSTSKAEIEAKAFVMSINWVMLSTSGSGDFIRLPNEQILYSSPPRVSISLDSMNKYPGHQPWALSCGAGRLHLTNKRIVYLPTNPPTVPSTTSPVSAVATSTTTNPLDPHPTIPTPSFTAPPSSTSPAPRPTLTVLTSFAALHARLKDAHVTAPWFGPNAWVVLVQPVRDGGIPSHLPAIEAHLTFKDGGAFDWHTKYCEVRDRLAQVREMMREVGEGEGGTSGSAVGPEVHLEQLPAYEAMDTRATTNTILQPTPIRPVAARAEPIPPYTPASNITDRAEPTAPALQEREERSSSPAVVASPRASAPDELPPAYEESQTQQRDELGDSLRRLGVGEQ